MAGYLQVALGGPSARWQLAVIGVGRSCARDASALKRLSMTACLWMADAGEGARATNAVFVLTGVISVLTGSASALVLNMSNTGDFSEW